mgnify:CR=1 FL=1
MKQTFLMLAAISGALLTGCSNEEIASVDNLSQNAIGFHVVGNAAETRATPITPNNLTTTNFDVFAYTADGTAFMGVADTDWAHDGVKIVYKGGKWDYDDPSELHYWPTEDKALDFYAVSPGSVLDGQEGMHYMWNFNHDSQNIYYTCMNEYGEGTGKHADHDVMYGIAKNQTKSTSNGVVKFTFKHILSQVVFKAKTELSTMNVVINGIKIANAKINGTFALPSDANADPTAANWTLHPELGYYNPVIIRDKEIEVNSNIEEVTDISSKTPIFTIPQTLTKWAVKDVDTKTIYNANIARQSYLEISCKIQQSGVYLYGSANEYKTIYVPFGASWEPGKRYIYTLIFGGGYDDNGDAILNPIEFDAETTDWVDAEGNVAM